MCTAATYRTKDFYFGRTLDYECNYGEEVTITPRNYPFAFRHMGEVKTHYAIIGMAHVAENYPLYYDAINEKGLGMAGLNFVGNAKYQEVEQGRENVAQFEFIPWILSQCSSVEEAKEKGYVETLFHRRRYIPELKSKNYMVRQFGMRAAMNTPIQGTAADIMKIAMINVLRELKAKNMKSKIVLQVHDEMMIEAPMNEAEEVKKIIKFEMENAVKLDVPLIAEVSEAKNWYECK